MSDTAPSQGAPVADAETTTSPAPTSESSPVATEPVDPASPAGAVERLDDQRALATTVDASVVQGNRNKTQAQLDPNSPVSQLEAKIRSHFDALGPVIGDLKAAIDEIETLANTLRVGF